MLLLFSVLSCERVFSFPWGPSKTDPGHVPTHRNSQNPFFISSITYFRKRRQDGEGQWCGCRRMFAQEGGTTTKSWKKVNILPEKGGPQHVMAYEHHPQTPTSNPAAMLLLLLWMEGGGGTTKVQQYKSKRGRACLFPSTHVVVPFLLAYWLRLNRSFSCKGLYRIVHFGIYFYNLELFLFPSVVTWFELLWMFNLWTRFG